VQAAAFSIDNLVFIPIRGPVQRYYQYPVTYSFFNQNTTIMKKLSFLGFLALFLLAGCVKDSFQLDNPYDEYRFEKIERDDKNHFHPLKGELTFTTVSTTVEEEIVMSVYEGSGKLTHLGKVTCEVTQNVPPSGIFYGTFEITAANGDRLDMEYSGHLTNLDPVTLEFTSEVDFEIIGGSGRFDDAIGSGKGFGSGTFPKFPPMGDPITITAKIDGRIMY
jgi:hypothetical protein